MSGEKFAKPRMTARSVAWPLPVNANDPYKVTRTPEKLKGQEEFKAERAETLKTKLALEESVEPILAQMFKLYYIEPAQAKATLEDLFGLGGDSGGGEGETAIGSVSSNLSITIESTTRSIIVRGYQKDLDIVDAVVKEIDVRTKQVLIEAFIVEADSEFERALGTRLGGAYQRNAESILIALGFKVKDYTYVDNIGKDMVLGVEFEGESIESGSLIPKKSILNLILGNGKK